MSGMGNFKRLILILVFLLSGSKVFCAQAWNNDLQSLFLANKALIYAINIRTFNAKDINKDGIIDEAAGEERGSFINAIDRLDELVNAGINTIQLLPITPTGKVKALGTAGSLYAPSSFNEINPQLKSINSTMTVDDEMRKFVDECHKRNLRVIVDLPCCGSYDLYLKNSLLFNKDKNQNPIIPSDWTDVRLLDAGSENQINMDVYNQYASFVDMVVDLNVDGIRANVPTTKTYSFWKKLIDETKARNPQFVFIAEASLNAKNPVPNSPVSTPCQKLLDAGFDGYYGNYNELKNWQKASDLFSNVKKDIEISAKYSGSKRVIGNFATHDQISPILVNGPQLSEMIIWLNSTLPLNSYSIDGFPTGDNYIYYWANKKAKKTFTDDDYYFAHRGQLDIFNFSRQPMGNNQELNQDFVMANRFKVIASDILSNGIFKQLTTTSDSVFAYARSYKSKSIIVIGNLNFKAVQKVTVTVPKLTPDLNSIPIKITTPPIILKGKIKLDLAPGEIQVLIFNDLGLN